MAPEGKPYPLELGGWDTQKPVSRVYPNSPDLQNVRWTWGDVLANRAGFIRYSYRAMTDVSSAKEAVTGLFGFNRRDTTTRYTIACTPTRILVVLTTDADWTGLVTGMALSGATDFWDAAVFNNELILVNGKESPRITDGTAGGTGTLTGRVWQTRTASPLAQARSCGMKAIDMEGVLYHVGGDSATGTYDGLLQIYDPDGDSWKSGTRMTLSRTQGQTFEAYGKIFCAGGRQANSTFSATGEMYNPETDSWTAITSMTAAVLSGRGHSTGGFGYVACGNPGTTVANVVATNYKYDPAVDAWTTKTAYTTAREWMAGFEISGVNFITGGHDSSEALLATSQGYDTNANGSVTTASLGTARRYCDGTAGNADGKGYVVGGAIAGATTTATTACLSYDLLANAWTTEAVKSIATEVHSCGTSGRWIYSHGGDSGNALLSMERFNTSPTAPTACYVESFRGYLMLARSSSFPSRVWYSGVGDARYWDPNAFFDVNPDDGDWITGMFTFDGRFYVSKIGQMYQITGSIFDPEEGDIGIVPIENVPGAVSNRSIVVTDQGVFYLAKDGYRVFDGSRSINISGPIQNTLDGYADSRNKYVCGAWNKGDDEIWWSMTSTGSTHQRVVVYNYTFKRWSVFVGINAETLSVVEDANDVEQILFGLGAELTGASRNGFIYKANTGDHDVAFDNSEVAINSYYQTGWFAPSGILTDHLPSSLYLLTTRPAASTTLTVTTYTDYGSTARQTDSIQLYNQATPVSPYFQDTTDKRCRIQLGGEASGHVISHKFANATASNSWQIEGAIMVGKDGSVTSNP